MSLINNNVSPKQSADKPFSKVAPIARRGTWGNFRNVAPRCGVETNRETVTYRGNQNYEKITYETSRDNIIDRVGHCAFGALKALIALPAVTVASCLLTGTGFTPNQTKANIKGIWKSTANSWKKKTKRVEYEKIVHTGRQETIKARSLKVSGLDPKNRAALNRYVHDNEHHLKEDNNGNKFLIMPDDGGFIFMPQGNESKTCFMAAWKVKNGESIASYSQLLKMARSYSVAYETIIKQAGDTPFDTVVFYYDHSTLRIHNNCDHKTHLNEHSGKEIKLDKSTWKDVKRFFDKGKIDEKRPLEPDPTKKTRSNTNNRKRRRRASLPHISDFSEFMNRPDSSSRYSDSSSQPFDPQRPSGNRLHLSTKAKNLRKHKSNTREAIRQSKLGAQNKESITGSYHSGNDLHSDSDAYSSSSNTDSSNESDSE